MAQVTHKITVSQIWKVSTENFLAYQNHTKNGNRPLKLSKGEHIEIRYPYEWNFRTEDGMYFNCKPQMIYENASLVGIVWDKIRSNNEASLAEIIKLKLYDPI